MLKVKLAHYEQEHGVPLTREEEQAFVSSFWNNPDIYKQAFAFMLYTGVRRAELSSTIIEDGWVHIVTAKQRKGHKEKVRSLPIYYNIIFLIKSIIKSEKLYQIS